MAYAVVHHFKGGTREQFEAVTAKTDPPDGSLVEGELFEFSGPSDDGWIVVGVFESRGAWETFLHDTLMPVFQEVGAAGFAGPPAELAFEAINVKAR